jgi:hypothetical protein
MVEQLSLRDGIWIGLDSSFHLVAAVWVPRLALPGVLLVALSLIAADPRPALGAALYGACSLLVALSVHIAYGSYLDRLSGSEFAVAAVTSVAGMAATTQVVLRHRRRLARH